MVCFQNLKNLSIHSEKIERLTLTRKHLKKQRNNFLKSQWKSIHYSKFMKAHWHTWNLFIRGWKYKWSYKHDHCIECGTCKFKHKGKGLCTSCTEKKRAKNPKRKLTLEKANTTWIKKNRDQFNDYQRKWHNEYYHKNKEVMDLLRAGLRYKKAGKPVLIVQGKPIPFMELIKPNSISDQRYAEWKKNNELFLKLKNFLEK